MTELAIDFGVPGVMALVGLGLVFFVGVRKWRRKAARRCFKCGYDMRATPGLVCPECGWEGKSQREVEHGRVRRWAVWVGVLMCVPAVWVSGFFAVYTKSGLERRVINERLNGTVGDIECFFSSSGGFDDVDQWSFEGVRRRVIESVADWNSDHPKVFKSGYVPNGSFKPTGLTLDTWNDDRLSEVPEERIELVYLAHAWLFPVDHYWGYFGSPCNCDVFIRGTGNNVVPDDVLEMIGKVSNCNGVWECSGVVVDGRVLKSLGGLSRSRAGAFSNVTATPQEIGLLRRSRFLSLSLKRELNDEDVGVLAEFKDLRDLSLCSVGFGGKSFSDAVGKLICSQRIESVEINVPHQGLTDEKRDHAREHFEAMKSLSLDVTDWTDGQVKMLAGGRCVERLSLKDSRGTSRKTVECLDWIWTALRLKSIALEGFDGVVLKRLPEIDEESGGPGVRSLWLKGIRVDPGVVKQIEKHPLTRVTLDGVGLSNDELEELMPSDSLRTLEVAGWRCGEKAARRLGNCRELRVVEVDSMSERSLDLLFWGGHVKRVVLWKPEISQKEADAVMGRYPNVKVVLKSGGEKPEWEPPGAYKPEEK